MKLYIIRHGQTDWNVQGRIQGRQDIPLNAAGRSQAQMLAKGMEKRPVTAIYSSPQLPATVAPPGGETLNQVDARCKKAWERIKGEIKGDTAVVAHGGTLAHFIVHLLEGRPDAAEIVVGNASITTIEYDPVTGQCSLAGLNDCSHLM